MVKIQAITEQPLNKDSVMTINRRRVQGALDRRSIGSLNTSNKQEVNQRSYDNHALQNSQGGAGNRGVNTATPQPVARVVPAMAVPRLENEVRKGQKLQLEATGNLQKIQVRMGWNILNSECDVDVSAFLLGNGKVLGDSWFVFYGQETSPDGSTVFSENTSPDRESISIDFKRLNSSVDRIVFILTINEAAEKHLNFSMIKDAYIRIIDSVSNRELVSFRIDEYYSNVISMTIGEIYLHNGTWKFNAVGNGVGKDLAGLCRLYGVQVE